MMHGARGGLWAVLLLFLLNSSALAEPPAARTDLHGDPLPDGALARLGSMRFRHGDTVSLFDFLADGRQLLTIGQRGVAHIWEVPGGRVVRRFGTEQKRDNVYYVVSTIISPDRRYLAWGSSADRVLRVWDVASGQELWQRPPEAKGTAYRPVAFAPNGKTLLVEGAAAAWVVHDTVTGDVTAQLEAAPKNARSFYPSFSADGKLLAAKGQDAVIRLWDTGSGKLLRQLGENSDPKQSLYSLNRVYFSPDGKLLITQRMVRAPNQQPTFTGSVLIYDVATGTEVRQIAGPKEGVKGELALSPDCRTLAWHVANNTIQIVDLATGEEKHRLGEAGQESVIAYRILFSPDGKSVLVRGRRSPTASGIRLYDLASGEERWNRAMDAFQAVFSPDGRTVAVTTSTTRAVQLWDTQTGKDLPSLSGHLGEITALTIAPDGRTVITLGADTLRRWDAATGKQLAEVAGPAGAYYYSAALAADGRTVAFSVRGNAGQTPVQVWDLAANKPISQVDLPRPGLLALGLSPDGATLAVRSNDQSILLFDTATGKQRLAIKEQVGARNPPDGRYQLQPLLGNGRFLFMPDGTTLATVWLATITNPQGKQTRQFIVHQADLRTGKSLGRFTVGQGEVYSDIHALSADGRCLALLVRTTGAAPTFGLHLVEMASGKTRVQIAVEPGSALALSPDGSVFAVNGPDGTIHVLRTTGGELARLTGHGTAVRALAFSADGRRLVSGAGDTTALVWDVASLTSTDRGPGGSLDAQAFDGLWTMLASADADKPFQAMHQLWRAPADAVAQLRTRLKPVVSVDAARLARLLADLESDEFSARQKAEDELGKLGELASGAVQKALDQKPPLDLRQRLERLAERTTARLLGPEQLRGVRAIEVLERIGTPEARQVLETLAKGAPEARQTRDSRAALDRLSRLAVAGK